MQLIQDKFMALYKKKFLGVYVYICDLIKFACENSVMHNQPFLSHQLLFSTNFMNLWPVSVLAKKENWLLCGYDKLSERCQDHGGYIATGRNLPRPLT